MNLSDNEACYILSGIKSLGPKTVGKLKNLTESYAGILSENPKNFEKIGFLNEKQIADLKNATKEIPGLLNEQKNFLESGINMFCPSDKGYPKRLKNMADPPTIIFVRGKLPLDDQPAASIIGARQCSDYGISVAEFFSAELSKNNVNIISGLAYGIDAAASRGALKAGHDSFAILGSGVNRCYPMENYKLYSLMAGLNEGFPAKGGIISEFHPNEHALPLNFVMRNRLIAGFCDVLLVIEAREKSGTSITVGYALDQGKEIFALPGRITDPLGRGCNKLLRDGATPLLEPGDVLSFLGIDNDAADIMGKKDLSSLSKVEKIVWSELSEDFRHVEDIAKRANLNIRDVGRILGNLELKKYVQSSGGAYYKKI